MQINSVLQSEIMVIQGKGAQSSKQWSDCNHTETELEIHLLQMWRERTFG